MSETTETTSQTSATGWQEAMAASAEASKPSEPKPRPFVEELDVKLTERERVQIAVKFADTCQQVTTKKAELKAIVSEHKADIAALEGTANELGDAVRTGRVKREVQCEERISFSQNRKFSVRLDTNEEFDEMPLSASDRQTLLIPEDKEDGQLTLAQVGDPDPPPFVDESSPDDDGSAPDSTTNMVDDPEGLLLAASTPSDPEGSEPPVKPTRRGRRTT